MPSTFHRRRFIRLVAVAAIAAATMALSACSGGAATTPSDDSTPVKGGTLKLAFWPDNANLTSIDPFQIYWLETRTVLRNVVDSLTDQDPKTGELVPWLATDWKAADNNTRFTFTLRSGVTFSDGTPFTAESVKLAFDSDAASVKSIPGVFGASYISGYQGTEVVDDDTVEVTFAKPNAAFLQATSTTNLGILSAGSYRKTPAERSKGQIVGSGPFTLDSYDPTKGIELSRRTGYRWASKLNAHQGDAYLKHVSVSYVAEDSVRLGQLTSNAVDIEAATSRRYSSLVGRRSRTRRTATVCASRASREVPRRRFCGMSPVTCRDCLMTATRVTSTGPAAHPSRRSTTAPDPSSTSTATCSVRRD